LNTALPWQDDIEAAKPWFAQPARIGTTAFPEAAWRQRCGYFAAVKKDLGALVYSAWQQICDYR